MLWVSVPLSHHCRACTCSPLTRKCPGGGKTSDTGGTSLLLLQPRVQLGEPCPLPSVSPWPAWVHIDALAALGAMGRVQGCVHKSSVWELLSPTPSKSRHWGSSLGHVSEEPELLLTTWGEWLGDPPGHSQPPTGPLTVNLACGQWDQPGQVQGS